MKITNVHILLKDRTLLVLGAAILSVVIFTVTSFIYAENIRDENEHLTAQLARIHAEGGNIMTLRAAVTSKEKKASVRSAGIVPTLEKTLKGLRLKATVIKPLGEKKVDEFTEENAELEIHEADLNSIVNLLYMIEASGAPMKIKNASIQTTFEDPDKFILKLTAARISR